MNWCSEPILLVGVIAGSSLGTKSFKLGTSAARVSMPYLDEREVCRLR